jgi:hypothetical protein
MVMQLGASVGDGVGDPTGVAVAVEETVGDTDGVLVRVGVVLGDGVAAWVGVRVAQLPVPRQTAPNTGTQPLTQAPATGGPHAACPEKLH